jgi:hypothetical protein
MFYNLHHIEPFFAQDTRPVQHACCSSIHHLGESGKGYVARDPSTRFTPSLMLVARTHPVTIGIFFRQNIGDMETLIGANSPAMRI